MDTVEFYPIPKEMLDFFIKHVPPEAIVNFRLSDDLQARAAELTEKNKADSLTPEERAELEQLMRFNLKFGEIKLDILKTLKVEEA